MSICALKLYDVAVTKNYDYDFICDDKEFMENFKDILSIFFKEHNGKIIVRESEIPSLEANGYCMSSK
jgi:hypothetical protein